MNYYILYNTNTRKYGYITKPRFDKLQSRLNLVSQFEVVGFKNIVSPKDFKMLKRVVRRLSKTFSYLQNEKEDFRLSA